MNWNVWDVPRERLRKSGTVSGTLPRINSGWRVKSNFEWNIFVLRCFMNSIRYEKTSFIFGVVGGWEFAV